jgi:two-component system response regulator DesR
VIRVLFVGDPPSAHPPALSPLAEEPDIEVVGHLAFDTHVATRAAKLSPAVVVINTDYMVGQVLPTVADLRVKVPKAHILMLVDPTKPGMLPPRRRTLGVSFLIKDSATPALAETVRRLTKGERIVHPRLEIAALTTEHRISTRELEILALVAEGAPIVEIAERLRLAPGTVRNYLSGAIAKTGARNRIDAIRIARRDGWLL